MAIALKASERGLQIVDRARKIKRWNKSSVSWAQAALVGQAALKKFWRRQNIVSDNFVAICKAVGVNWEDIVDSELTDSAEELERDRLTVEGGWLIEFKALIEEDRQDLMTDLFNIVQELPGNVSINKRKVSSGFDASWQSLDSFFNSDRRGDRDRRQNTENFTELGKRIEFDRDRSVILVVGQSIQKNEEVTVDIEVYPDSSFRYLPVGLSANILDENRAFIDGLNREIVGETESLYFHFTLEREEELFFIQLSLDNTTIIESF
jgi:hypothetical protein